MDGIKIDQVRNDGAHRPIKQRHEVGLIHVNQYRVCRLAEKPGPVARYRQ
jgi:hypothetical protein